MHILVILQKMELQKNKNNMRKLFNFNLIALTALIITSCGGKKATMDDVVSYYKSKGYYGEVRKDSTDYSEKKKTYSEMICIDNLKITLDKMKSYGYFLNNVKNQNFILGDDDINKICAYGVFNPFYIIIQKKNDSYSGFGKWPEDEYFKISTMENLGGFKSYFCNDSANLIIADINKKIKEGTFQVPELKDDSEPSIDSNLLCASAFQIWNESEIKNIYNIPFQLIQSPNGYLWIDGNTFTNGSGRGVFDAGRSEYDLGYSLHYFDKNGFLKWSAPGMDPLHIDNYAGNFDRYVTEGYKFIGDTIMLLIKHTLPTTDKLGKKDLCYEVFVQKMDRKTGNILKRQTLAKHFNKDYVEAFKDLTIVGLEEDPTTYFSTSDELSAEENNLIGTFTPTQGQNQVSESNDKFEFKKNGEKSVSLFKNGKDIFDNKSAMDKCFDSFMYINYSKETKEFAGIARGYNFWRETYYYIRTIDLNGKSKPIILKQKQ